MCSTSVAGSAGTRCSAPNTDLPSRRSTALPPVSTLLAARRPRGLRLSLRQADADALPFSDQTFDYVLSWNVIFHGTMGDVGRRLAEIWRVLKPGGLYQGTMLSQRDAQFGRGRSVAPDTFIRGSDAKAHAHYYCDLAGLAALFAGFELLSLTQEEQRRPGSWHWHILAERR